MQGKVGEEACIREDFLVHFRPAGDAAAGHSEVDQIERLLAKGPRAFVVARDTEAQIRGDPVRCGSATSSIAARVVPGALTFRAGC